MSCNFFYIILKCFGHHVLYDLRILVETSILDMELIYIYAFKYIDLFIYHVMVS